jgi:hypothetical protein
MTKRKARPILEDMLAYAEEAHEILDSPMGKPCAPIASGFLRSRELSRLSAKQPTSSLRILRAVSQSICNRQSPCGTDSFMVMTA